MTLSVVYDCGTADDHPSEECPAHGPHCPAVGYDEVSRVPEGFWAPYESAPDNTPSALETTGVYDKVRDAIYGPFLRIRLAEEEDPDPFADPAGSLR